jgi:hypothetical protein
MAKSAERVASTGLTRKPGLMYFVKQGAVWSVPMKKPGKPKGRAERLAKLDIDLDYSKYLYYLSGKLEVMRTKRKNR